MLYLVTPHNDRVRALIASGAVGTFVTPKSGSRPIGSEPWGGDNGAYNGFEPERFARLLERFAPVAGTCLFVAVPDVVADWPGTLDRYAEWSGAVASYGYPRAVVAQDGATAASVPWGDCEALFLGGTTEWKLGPGAAALARAARARGLHVHMGRVNSYRRLAYARSIGCDSADGTFLKFAPDANVPRLERWLARLEAEPPTLPL